MQGWRIARFFTAGCPLKGAGGFPDCKLARSLIRTRITSQAGPQVGPNLGELLIRMELDLGFWDFLVFWSVFNLLLAFGGGGMSHELPGTPDIVFALVNV